MLAEHQVRQGLLVAILDRGRRQGLVKGEVATVTIERALAGSLGYALFKHAQSVVALDHAYVPALGAALAVGRVDEEAEVGPLDALLGRHVAVLGSVDEVRPCGRLGQLWVRLGGRERLDRLGQRAIWLGRRPGGAVLGGGRERGG